MAAPNLRNMVFFAAATTMLVVLLAGLQCANAETVKVNVNLRDCDPDNNGVSRVPSPSNCPKVIVVIPKGGTVRPVCRYKGSTVEGDPWWLYVKYGNYKGGFVADSYVNCGGTVCPYAVCPN